MTTTISKMRVRYPQRSRRRGNVSGRMNIPRRSGKARRRKERMARKATRWKGAARWQRERLCLSLFGRLYLADDRDCRGRLRGETAWLDPRWRKRCVEQVVRRLRWF